MPLHIKILIGMVLGAIWGGLASNFGWLDFTDNWIKPFGTIFVNSLKLIAVPLILVSLIDGISNLTDMSKLSRIGGKTVSFYIISTVLAITIGVLLVNFIQPGDYVTESKKEELKQAYAPEANLRVGDASKVKDEGPLKIMIDIVPDNIFFAASENKNMLQVIFFSILFGIAMILSPQDKIKPIKGFFHSANAVILRIVEIIMNFESRRKVGTSKNWKLRD